MADLEIAMADAPPLSSHTIVRWIFLRGIGLVYLIAFASVFVQVLGLIGSQGILPANLFLKEAAQNAGPIPFLTCPTFFWLNCSDAALRLLAGTGILFSFLVIAGVCTGPLLFLLWFMYLSIVTVGGDFMSFQWDVLLLEAGFLAVFYSHFKLLDLPWKFANQPKLPAPSSVVLWLLRLLLFKLMFSSGCVKLLSGDIFWQNFSALNYHYWTQPLPTPLAWFAAQLPEWFQKLSVVCMFFIELIVPWFIFAPGRFRLIAALLFVVFQLLIALTGNYTFFNLLTIILCVLLLDDRTVRKFVPGAFADSIISATVTKPPTPLTRVKLSILVATIALLTLARNIPVTPEPIRYFSYLISPWCLVNGYGLFAVMTTSRKEIIVEASEDGANWQAYQFYFKPGDLRRAPSWVAPYQPRLDWQMWFAALGTRRDSPWFAHFVLRLLQGAPDVRLLLKNEPFNGRIPKFVKASLYDYEFTDWQELTKTGAWWKRKYVGLFFPVASLRATEEVAPLPKSNSNKDNK